MHWWPVKTVVVMCLALSTGAQDCPPWNWVVDTKWQEEVQESITTTPNQVSTGKRMGVKRTVRKRGYRYFITMRSCYTYCMYGIWETDVAGYELAIRDKSWP